jgi:hypothetical protein
VCRVVSKQTYTTRVTTRTTLIRSSTLTLRQILEYNIRPAHHRTKFTIKTRNHSIDNMRFTLATITALVAPLVAQSVTPAPTATDPWYGSGPSWASSDPGKWSSIYNSLVSDGRIPSTLTAAPWPTGSYGPGQGPWGPGGHGGPGGGGHWGGTFFDLFTHFHLYPVFTL